MKRALFLTGIFLGVMLVRVCWEIQPIRIGDVK